jgi:hypothetical protein
VVRKSWLNLSTWINLREIKYDHETKFFYSIFIYLKKMDRFEIETADLGRIYRVKIRHDDSGISADWFLDRVEIHDHKRSYIFLCERWLSTSKEDKRIERSLYEKVLKKRIYFY